MGQRQSASGMRAAGPPQNAVRIREEISHTGTYIHTYAASSMRRGTGICRRISKMKNEVAVHIRSTREEAKRVALSVDRVHGIASVLWPMALGLSTGVPCFVGYVK